MIAANDVEAALAIRRGLQVGRFIPYVNLALTGVGIALTAYELYQLYLDWNKQGVQSMGKNYTYVTCSGGGSMTGSQRPVGVFWGAVGVISGMCNQNTVTAAVPPTGYGNWNQLSGTPVGVRHILEHTATSNYQFDGLGYWQRGLATGAVIPRPYIDLMPNPNVRPSVNPNPETQPGTRPFPDPLPPIPDPRGDTDPNPGSVQDPGPITPVQQVITSTGVVTLPVSPTNPRPPGPKVPERKVRSIGTILFSILDSVSETAEVIGAFYDALPKDIRKRWDQKGRGLIDQAGQYGIDGADWKLQALYHNWDRVDFLQALRNVAKNEIEDKVIGEIMRRLPKQVGSAITDPAFKAYGDLSQWVASRG